MKKLLLIGFLACIFMSCDRNKGIEVQEVTFYTKQVDVMKLWYVHHLDFEDAGKKSVSRDDLTLRFRQPEDLSDTLPTNYMEGFFKLGFETNQFDELVSFLREEGAQFHGQVVKDQKINRRTVIVKDPDGNKIQFFESFDSHKLRPYFISVLTPSIGEVEKWYQMKFPVVTTYNQDVPDREIYIRILECEDFLFEIIQTPTIKPRKLAPGIKAITISGGNASFETDKGGNQLVSSD